MKTELTYNTDFGEINCNGKTYTLQASAEITGNVFESYNYNDVEEGEEYQFSMAAPATDENGKEYTITWLFWDRKGEDYELALEDFDYEDVHSIEED